MGYKIKKVSIIQPETSQNLIAYDVYLNKKLVKRFLEYNEAENFITNMFSLFFDSLEDF